MSLGTTTAARMGVVAADSFTDCTDRWNYISAMKQTKDGGRLCMVVEQACTYVIN